MKTVKSSESVNNGILYTSMKFGEVSQRWLSDEKSVLAGTTYAKYDSSLQKYLLPLLESKIVGDISENDITEYLKTISENSDGMGRCGGKLKSGTLYFLRVVVHRVLDYARDMDFPKKEELNYGKDRDEYEALSAEEIKKICRCAKYNRCPEMLGVMLMLFCGIRLGEICALSCEDIDLADKEIFIHQSAHRVKGTDTDSMGHKTKLIVADIPSATQIRTAIIPENLVEYVKEFYIEGAMLLTGERNKPMEARTFKNRFDRILAEYKMGSIPFQRLRKTYVMGLADTEILQRLF